jgi:acetylornithine deacetylase/succinyl-diaminopimelate desuccinylase-like protein
MLNSSKLADFVESAFEKKPHGVIESLSDFIRIPNVSPIFDAQWDENGLEQRAFAHLAAWCKLQPIAGMSVELLKHPHKTSLLFIEIAAFGVAKANQSTVLCYSHADKQPPLPPWSAGLAPYEPVLRDGKLYGCGGGDDGYGVYSALTAIAAIQALGHSHARTVVIVEGSEESGSPHLMHYVDFLAPRIGTPSLVCALDSGTENYLQLWMTSSLRGLVAGTLRVDILREGIHSGNSGVAASSFRILRRLLDRIEDADTGAIVADGFSNGIPDEHVQAAKRVAEVVGDAVWKDVPLVDGARPVSFDNAELLLNKTWRPTLSITGVGGIPALKDAGNVLRSHTAVKISLRLPPNVDAPTAGAKLKALLERDPVRAAGAVADRRLPLSHLCVRVCPAVWRQGVV